MSVCSGVEAASLAWGPLGWEAAAVSDVDPFACAVLAHRLPGVPNLGDMARIRAADVGRVDVLVGGTPCQAFSVAGGRGGVADPRGALMFHFVRLAGELRPRWVVWENVPGVLSVDGGWAFAALVRGLADRGYAVGWRVLDALGFGVPQRRRRAFVVGHLGGGPGVRAVLSFAARSPRDIAARGCEGGDNAAGVAGRTGVYGARGRVTAAPALLAKTRGGLETEAPVLCWAENSRAQLRFEGGHGRHAGTVSGPGGKAGQSTPCVLDARQDPICLRGASLPLGAKDTGHAMLSGGRLRRLTPRECERLQGMPDDWTRVPYRGRTAEDCPDGPRYRAIGNSMAVPVMRWLGRGIAEASA